MARRTIVAFTEPVLPAGDKVVAYFNLGRADDIDGVSLIARDQNGRQLEILVPEEDWQRVRQAIVDEGGPPPALT